MTAIRYRAVSPVASLPAQPQNERKSLSSTASDAFLNLSSPSYAVPVSHAVAPQGVTQSARFAGNVVVSNPTSDAVDTDGLRAMVRETVREELQTVTMPEISALVDAKFAELAERNDQMDKRLSATMRKASAALSKASEALAAARGSGTNAAG